METPLKPGFALTPRFFGLNSDHGFYIQKLIFDVIWQSQGRFDWDTLYYMPIHIRNMYVQRLNAIISGN